jgi:dTDP-4-amino-4,6-dideoxygalactose transaminase
MDAVIAIAKRHSLPVIEDAAQAHAAEWQGRKVGAIGDIGTFSFQASKNLNAGEGGILVTENESLAEAAWSVTHVGRVRDGQWYEHHVLGSNFRLTEFQSSLLRSQLKRLPDQTARRERNAKYLRTLLSTIPGIRLPSEDPRITCHAYHLFTLRFIPEAFGGRSLEDFLKALNAEGVPCTSGYVPLYQEPLFARYAAKQGAWCQAGKPPNYPNLHLPVCEAVCADTVWLHQNMLLGDAADMEDIATAIVRIQQAT